MHFALVIKAHISRQIVHINWLISFLSDSLIGVVLERHRDVVLVTGGSSGLGKEVVKEFQKRRIQRLVVFDLNLPSEGDKLKDVYYYQCDVSDKNQVKAMSERVKSEVGIVTILINNAGITSGKCLLDLSLEEIEKIIQVNLMSSFYLNKAFLPDMAMLKRGYIITVASVLGYMSPANLSKSEKSLIKKNTSNTNIALKAAYGASKSALIALHESLTYELGPPMFSKTGIKTLLVCPGQLKTRMFKGVNTPSSILAPELDPQYVAQKIVRAVEYGRRGELKFPIYGNFLALFRSSPWPVTQFVRLISGMDESMQTYEHDKVATHKTSDQAAILGEIISSST